MAGQRWLAQLKPDPLGGVNNTGVGMNRRARVLASLLLGGCVTSPQSPIEGAWRSNRDLTLKTIKAVPGMTPERLAAYERPDLFGHQITVWRPDRAMVILDGRCEEPVSYRLVATTSEYVDLEFNPSTQDSEVRRFFLTPGHIELPIVKGQAREIFTPIDSEALLKEAPCAREFAR